LVSILVVFFYYVTGAVGIALGKSGKLLPFISAWANNIVFAASSLFFIDRANH